MPGARPQRWLIAVAGAGLVLAVTARYGVGISLDSVVYARAADSLRAEGTLEVPLTTWGAEASHVPLSHFPPLLPIALAGLGAILNVDSHVAARWLNAGCLVATVLVATAPLADSVIGLALLVALLVGPSFLTMHVWLWSEPLFLLLLVASVRLAAAASLERARISTAALLGACCGLATLTRYAGASLPVAYVLLLVLAPASAAVTAKRIAAMLGVFVATMLPWLWYLAVIAGPPRELGVYVDGVWGEVIVATVRTAAAWFVPAVVPTPVGAVIVVALVAVLARRARTATRADGREREGSLARTALAALVVQFSFLIAARVFVDPGMPFDERILSSTLVLLALALADVARGAYPTGAPLVPAALVACLALVSFKASAPHLVHSARHGQGYAGEEWARSETLDRLSKVPADVTIFSNAPDIIAARLPVAAKYTPALYDGERLGELARRIEESAPSLVVLFDDPHAGWLVPRERLLEALGAFERHSFADAVVLSRGRTGLEK